MSEPMTWLDWTVVGMISCAYMYIVYKFKEIGGGKRRDWQTTKANQRTIRDAMSAL